MNENKKLLVLKKPEIYSFDELSYLKNIVNQTDLPETERNDLLEKLNKMLSAIEESKESTAIFFMPQATYDLFSIFQGQTAICDFTKSDSQLLIDIFNQKTENSEMKLHISKKLKILNEFLTAGNSAKPVPSQASEFMELVI